MSKKLLSEAQVRKFMGLANLDANLSSNFLNEMYGEKEEKEMEDEGMYKMKKDDEMKEEVVNEEEEMEMDAEEADMERRTWRMRPPKEVKTWVMPTSQRWVWIKRKSLKSLSKQLVLFLV